MSYPKRLLLIAGVILVLVTLDQVSKVLAIRWLEGREAIDYLGGTFKWVFAKNKGAFLSLGARLGEAQRFWLLTAFNGVILVVVAGFVFLRKEIPVMVVLALAMILAGGIGNLIDRVFRGGEVVDFMNLGIGSLRTGVFNVADLAIVGGLSLLILMEFRAGRTATVETQQENSASE